MHALHRSSYGQLVVRFRHWIIAGCSVLVLLCLPFITTVVNPFQTTGFVVEGSQGDLTDELISKKLGYGHNQIVVLYHSKTLTTADPSFLSSIKASLKELKDYPIPHEVILPEIGGPQIAKHGHAAYAVILLKTSATIEPDQVRVLKNLIQKPAHLSIKFGGEPVFVEQIEQQTQIDLFNADAIAIPVTIITLLLIFGTVSAALVPLCIGGGCALLILNLLNLLGHIFTLSIFTLNIALLLGLCLSLDYALFIIYRFRDELKDNVPIQVVLV